MSFDIGQYLYEHRDKSNAPIVSGAKPNVRTNPAVRILATGKVLPFTEANRALIAAGLAEEINVTAAPRPQGDGAFVVAKDQQDVYTIKFDCRHCMQGGVFLPPPSKRDVEQVSFTHCGRVQVVPADVVKQYLKVKK